MTDRLTKSLPITLHTTPNAHLKMTTTASQGATDKAMEEASPTPKHQPPPASTPTNASPKDIPRPSDTQPRWSGLTNLERVQRKWQMASCAHFLATFKEVIPLRELSIDTLEDFTPLLLETAIAHPEENTAACIALRDIVSALLVAIGDATVKNVVVSWFESLRLFVDKNMSTFLDCFHDGENLLKKFDNGMQFLMGVTWNVRLGLLIGLCDSAAESATCVRDAIDQAGKAEGRIKLNEMDNIGVRLLPIGRCSRRRSFYKVGKTRIYSGFKRKGPGTLLVECSDSTGMKSLANSLDNSVHARDRQLATDIREKYLGPLLEVEEREQRKMEKKRLAQIEREESRRRNSHRPRRQKAAYL